MGLKVNPPKMRLGNTTVQDDESNAMTDGHAYLCNQDGVVEVVIDESLAVDQSVIGYDDTDSNPADGGDIRQRWATGSYGENTWKCFAFTMQKGRYFEIVTGGSGLPTVIIRWCPFGSLIKCTDYN